MSMIESMRFNLRNDLMNCIEQAFCVTQILPFRRTSILFPMSFLRTRQNNETILILLLPTSAVYTAHEINQAFIINKTVLMLIVISQIPQYIFIYSDATEQIA